MSQVKGNAVVVDVESRLQREVRSAETAVATAERTLREKQALLKDFKIKVVPVLSKAADYGLIVSTDGSRMPLQKMGARPTNGTNGKSHGAQATARPTAASPARALCAKCKGRKKPAGHTGRCFQG